MFNGQIIKITASRQQYISHINNNNFKFSNSVHFYHLHYTIIAKIKEYENIINFISGHFYSWPNKCKNWFFFLYNH